jgi:hypothetical protein
MTTDFSLYTVERKGWSFSFLVYPMWGGSFVSIGHGLDLYICL